MPRQKIDIEKGRIELRLPIGTIKRMTHVVKSQQRWRNLQEFVQEAINEKLDRAGGYLPTEDELSENP